MSTAAPTVASVRVWTRVVDVGRLYEFLSRNVEHSARRDVINILTHERFKFNWDNPTGHYRLEMNKKVCGIVCLKCEIFGM